MLCAVLQALREQRLGLFLPRRAPPCPAIASPAAAHVSSRPYVIAPAAAAALAEVALPRCPCRRRCLVSASPSLSQCSVLSCSAATIAAIYVSVVTLRVCPAARTAITNTNGSATLWRKGRMDIITMRNVNRRKNRKKHRNRKENNTTYMDYFYSSGNFFFLFLTVNSHCKYTSYRLPLQTRPVHTASASANEITFAETPQPITDNFISSDLFSSYVRIGQRQTREWSWSFSYVCVLNKM